MKTTLPAIIIFVFCSIVTKATSYELFVYDLDNVEQELSRLQSIEDYVNANPGITLLDLEADKSEILSGFNLNSSIMGSYDDNDGPPLGISSFLWGCCFGIVGVAVVYFVTDNKSETKSALTGCVISNLVSGGCLVVYYILVYYYYSSWWWY